MKIQWQVTANAIRRIPIDVLTDVHPAHFGMPSDGGGISLC